MRVDRTPTLVVVGGDGVIKHAVAADFNRWRPSDAADMLKANP